MLLTIMMTLSMLAQLLIELPPGPQFVISLSGDSGRMYLGESRVYEVRVTSEVEADYTIRVKLPEELRLDSVITPSNYSVSPSGRDITFQALVGPGADFEASILTVGDSASFDQGIVGALAVNYKNAKLSYASKVVVVSLFPVYIPIVYSGPQANQ